MKIALLNLPFDNNYGGNLQRYALVKVLENMGHEVTHIFLKSRASLPWYKKTICYLKRLLVKILFDKNTEIYYERKINEIAEQRNKVFLDFYEKYVTHTAPCYNIADIKKVCEKNVSMPL